MPKMSREIIKMLDYDNRYTSEVVSMKGYYWDKMCDYAYDTAKKFGSEFAYEVAQCVAIQFTDGDLLAKQIFKKLGLREVHAWAIQHEYKPFCASYDETEMNDND